MDEFTTNLSFVTPEKSKREAMSEIQVFYLGEWFILEVSTQDTQLKHFFLNHITLKHDVTFTFSVKLSF